MTSYQAQQYLESLINHEIHLDQIKSSAFKLERIKKLLKYLDDPQNDLKIIHVAGSKGKGSICALTANVLKEAGYNVGLYTSPHINSYRERIRILQKGQSAANTEDVFPDMISEEDLCDVLGEIKPAIEQVKNDKDLGQLSFFEVYTALALYFFKKQKVDFVILETGLGGRLDATNVARSVIAVIAPISLEHMKILGNTIEDIAKEKVAIIKDDKQKVVIAHQDQRVVEVIKNRCAQFNIVPLWVNEQIKSTLIAQDINGQTIDLSTVKKEYKQLSLPLLGKHQRENCMVAVSIVECLQNLGYTIAPEAIHKGIGDIFWPLRFEVVSKQPLIILDGAHNETSIKALAGLMKEIFNDKQITAIFGISKDKNKNVIFDELKGIANNIVFTKADHPRAENLPGALSVQQALDLVIQRSGTNDVILVTGSMFVASEARQYLTETILCTN